jgi:PAS domain S-box-containing protein
LSDVVAAAPIGVIVADRRGDDVLYFNDMFCEIWELQPIKGRIANRELKFGDVIAHCGVRTRDSTEFVRALRDLSAPDSVSTAAEEVELADGRTIKYVSRPVDDGRQGNARFYLFDDITQYKAAEHGFVESERRLRYFVEGVQDYAFYLMDTEGRITSWNVGAEKLKGYEAAEVIGESFATFYMSEETGAGLPERHLQIARQEGRHLFEGWQIRKDCSRFWAEKLIAAVRDENANIIGFAVITRDMTSRKLAEEAEHLNQARIRAIMDSTVDGLITINQDGIVQMFSVPAERIFGYAAREVVGHNVTMLMPDPYRTEHDGYIGNYLTTGVKKIIGIGREVQGRKKDGTIFPMDLAVGELPPSGERREFVGTIRDISERKTLERQLQQAQKMEAVGQLTGGVAHDFNNLLAVILGNLDMLQEAVDDPKIRALADAAMRATQRGSELTQRLLAFSRRQMLQPEIIDINVLVSGMVDLLARAIGEDIQVRTDLSPVSLCARVDPGQLENSLLNLAVNARDAMPDGGALTLETSDVVLDSQYAERSPDVTPGSYVMLAVSDTGTGMPPEVALRAFEPFFTTKEVGKGSGLGLSMVYGFVKQSGGHVTIYSEPSHGTTVKIYFPLVAGESAKPVAVDDANIPLGQGETVLVVEDDPDVRDLAIALLRQLGYTVIEASDGHKALALLADNPEIDLLLSDIVLPRGMSGAALAERVHKKRPNMPVLYMSGYAADSVIKRGIIDRGAKLISKPFRKAEIARKVHQALEERKTK